MQLEPTNAAKAPLDRLVAQFLRAIERRPAADAAILAALVRALSEPRGPARGDAERFAEIIRRLSK
jgi:hypothetical protein